MQFIGTGDRILTENFNVGYLYTITFKTGIYINSACIGIGDTFVMFQKAEPDLLFTLNVDTADEVDTIELYDSGGGTNDYDDLVNRPQINSHTLTGNMSGSDLGLQDTISDIDTIRAGAAAGATAVQPAALSDYQPLISDLDTIRAGASAGATAVQPADMTTALALKQDALNTAQLNAVNSGITSTDVAQIETNKNNILSKCVVCTCSTESGTAAKVIDAPQGFVLQEGCIIGVKFSYSNTATNVTLNVGSTGAKSIYYANGVYTDKGTKVTGFANYYIFYMYDGTNWVWLNYDFSATYSTMTQAQASEGTDTTGRLVPAKVLSDTIDEKIQPLENNILSKATSILIDDGNRNITSITYDISDYKGKFLQIATTRTADGVTFYGTSVYILRINNSLDVEQFTPIHEENNAKITGITIVDDIATITYDVVGYHITRAVVF